MQKDESGVPIRVCGVDPGLVNMAVWIGDYFPETHKVKTIMLTKSALGDGIDEGEDDEKPKGKKKQSVQEGSAKSAIVVADACLRERVSSVVVETAPQWNVPIRISAATTYGVLRGKGVSGVRYSAPTTKAKAISLLAEELGISSDLEKPADGADKLDKRTSAKIRLMNKRNAVRVVEKLLKHSDDELGTSAFNGDPTKRDDMADAILLACGTALIIQKETAPKKRKTRTHTTKTKK